MDITFFDDQYVFIIKSLLRSVHIKGQCKYFGDIVLMVSQINVQDIIFVEDSGYFVLFVNEKNYLKQDLNYLAYIVCKTMWFKYNKDIPYEYCFKAVKLAFDDYILSKQN